MFDCHIHIMELMEKSRRQVFLERLKMAGITGGILLSLPPSTFDNNSYTFKERLTDVLSLCEFINVHNANTLYPFFWLDPLDPKALEMVSTAVSEGIKGFKIMCIDDYPHNDSAMKVYQHIADLNKPILFHSGILWNNKASSNFNRPTNFECLIDIQGLRFALAHVSWPWHDECLAIYGKFNCEYAKDLGQKMYFDLTPGTPKIYREEVLTKLFTIGYHVEDNIIWGSDNFSEDYNVDWVVDWKNTDDRIFSSLNLTEELKDKIYRKNGLEFIYG